MNMFERNKAFYSDAEQEKLHNATVLQIGVGGIGCIMAELLVRSGVGTLILVDKDSFEITNLNRQIGATQDTLGKNKATAMAERLKSINPDVNVIVVEELLTKEWGEIIPATDINISDIDIMVDCADGIHNKLLVSDYAKKHKKKLVAGGINKYNFWTAVFDGNKGTKDVIEKRVATTAIVNQCTLFMCAGMMALFVCNAITGKLRGMNFAFKYKNEDKLFTRINL